MEVLEKIHWMLGFLLSAALYCLLKKKCSLDLSIEYVIDEQSIINCVHS